MGDRGRGVGWGMGDGGRGMGEGGRGMGEGGRGRVIQFPGRRIDVGNTVCDLQLYMCSLM